MRLSACQTHAKGSLYAQHAEEAAPIEKPAGLRVTTGVAGLVSIPRRNSCVSRRRTPRVLCGCARSHSLGQDSQQ